MFGGGKAASLRHSSRGKLCLKCRSSEWLGIGVLRPGRRSDQEARCADEEGLAKVMLVERVNGDEARARGSEKRN